MSRRPYYVMVATPSGEDTVVETRFGRWFASFGAAISLATRLSGFVYERTNSGRHLLRRDCIRRELSPARDGWIGKRR